MAAQKPEVGGAPDPSRERVETSAADRVAFGDFELDLRRRALLKDGERIHLTEKPLAALLLLVQQPGEVVSKRRLMDEVWRDTIVTEDSLVQAIGEVRRALADPKDDPRYIQTVPREGYRFLAKVVPVPSASAARGPVESPRPSAEPSAPSVSPPVGDVRSPGGGRRTVLALVAGSAFVGLAAAILWIVRSNGTPPSIVERQRLLSDFTLSGSHRSPSFSRDGNTIAYVSDSSGSDEVWVRGVAGGRAVRVTRSDDRSHIGRLRWSPAGDVIAYTRIPPGEEHATPSVWVVPPLGGAAHLLLSNARNPNWSRDGRTIVFERGAEIWLADRDGQNERRLAGVPDTPLLLTDRYPALSPDGAHVSLFNTVDGLDGQLWVVSVSDGSARKIVKELFEGAATVWDPSGRWIYFSSTLGGSRTIWRVDVATQTREPVSTGAGEDDEPELSADGRRLVYTNMRREFELVVMGPGGENVLRQGRQNILAPAFSPDGRSLAYSQSDGSGSEHLYVLALGSGEEPRQLTFEQGGKNVFPQWSGDGQRIYFYQRRPDSSFREISLTNGAVRVIGAGWTWARQHAARVHPDGESALYIKLRPRSIGEIALSDAPEAMFTRRLSDEQESRLPFVLDHPRWSPDGARLVGVSSTGGVLPSGEVVHCRTDGSDCRRLAPGYDPTWSSDGRLVHFLRARASADSADVRSIAADGSAERLTASIGPLRSIAHFYDVSPSGDVAFVRYRESRRELWIADLGR
jgi:Tol biopolymer transport system component/DNA-binding winged helix-turn-helix (wHTH) protein